MKSPFGGSYGMGRSGGSGSGSGGGMLRTMGRVVNKAGINGTQDSISSSPSSPTKKPSTKNFTQKSSASKHALSLSSSYKSTANNNYNLLAWPPLPNYFSANEFSEFDDQWEYVDNYMDDSVDHVFGPLPSSYEVERALFSLQQVIPPISSSSRFVDSEAQSDIEKAASNAVEKASSMSSDSDWIEPSMHICNQRFLQSYGLDRVYDAFHLLQTEPSVKRMVISLSSDKAVWDAILNNEAVREIREKYHNGVLEAAEPSPRIFDENSDPAEANPNVLKWIFDNMKAKLLEVIGAISQFLGELFKPLDQDKAEHSDTFSDKLKSSFLLTIMVLLIVVVARGQKA